MTLTSEEFLIVCRFLALVAADVPECGHVNISPVQFADKADFQANIGGLAMNTQKAIERGEIAVTTLTLAAVPQKPETHGEPWIYTFNFNIFRERTKRRLDENTVPDEFQKKLLESYYKFTTAILNLQAAFGSEEIVIAGLPDTITEAVAELSEAPNEISEDEPGRYISTVAGFSADIAVKVSITFQEC